jgi:hypothetical protein
MSLTTTPALPTPPTIPSGQQLILTATFGPDIALSDSVDGETVTFYDGGNMIGNATLTGLNATLTLNNLALGGIVSQFTIRAMETSLPALPRRSL